MDGYCLPGEMNSALAVLHTMKNEGMVPDIYGYNILINSCCKKLQLEKAMEFLQGHKPDIVTWQILLDGLCNQKLVEEASSLFGAVDQYGCIPDIVSYNILIDGLCNDGKSDKAKNIFDGLPPKGLELQTWTFNMMIRGLFQGLFEEAYELVVQMEANDCLPDDVTYNAIIQGCLLNKKWFKRRVSPQMHLPPLCPRSS